MAARVLDPVDPMFAALAKSVYPGADPQQLWAIAKSMPTTSDVSTPGQQQKNKRLAAVGLGATGVAGIGGLHALAGTKAEHAVRAAKLAEGSYEAPKLLGKLTPKKALAATTAGWVGLHSVELVGDALAARAQSRELKQLKTPVAKALPLLRARRIPHVEPESLVRADARARRVGLRLIGATGVAAGAGGGYAAGRHTRLRRAAPTETGEVAKVDLEFRGEISKVEDDKRQIFGWANLATVDGRPVIDLQGDYVPIEEIEKSAYGYMLTSRVGGNMHQRIGKEAGPVHVADVIESFVVTPEKLQAMGLAQDALPLGWWLGMKVNDEPTWQKVKSGELSGMSIHGSGVRSDALG